MPLKPVFSRSPLMTVPHCFLSCGTVRTTDQRIRRLYQTAEQWTDRPELWEGLFRIACLIKNKPLDEPVSGLILYALKDSDDGAMQGTIEEQIHIVRAAYAVYEYNADRSILQRIALWLRYLEVEFDSLCQNSSLLFRPADLMELLVRFYLSTGSKAVLRLCSRLRAESFDWTTALHTLQHAIPFIQQNIQSEMTNYTGMPESLDYDSKLKLINHAEMLADGVRYTVYSGLFSGHAMDLSSGTTAWKHLSRHHRALCGGTTSNPFLSGCGSNQPVSNKTIAAWTEAFSSQLILHNSEWALDELIRIVFNGLEDCLERETVPQYQYVNILSSEEKPSPDLSSLYARITRAVAAVYHHAVTLTEKGIRINYLIPGRFLLRIRKQTFVIQMNDHSFHFLCKSPFFAPVDLYISRLSSMEVHLVREGKTVIRRSRHKDPHAGFYLRNDGEWNDQDGFILFPDKRIIPEETHRQGVCYYFDNHLLSVSASAAEYGYSVYENPVFLDDKISVSLIVYPEWKLIGGIPEDIPVLPVTGNSPLCRFLSPYHENVSRITMFPRNRTVCLK